MTNPIIIEDDNFISDEEHQKFLQVIFNDKDENIRWGLKGMLAALNSDIFKGTDKFPYVSTPLAIGSKNSKPQLQVSAYLKNNEYSEIFDKFCKKHNIQYKKVIRAKVTILFMDNENYHNFIHIDAPIKHNVFLYYLNDSDGDTVFFNKKFEDNITSDKELSIQYSVTPKSKRGILFDGMIWHSSTPPTKNQLRAVLNIDYV